MFKLTILMVCFLNIALFVSSQETSTTSEAASQEKDTIAELQQSGMEIVAGIVEPGLSSALASSTNVTDVNASPSTPASSVTTVPISSSAASVPQKEAKEVTHAATTAIPAGSSKSKPVPSPAKTEATTLFPSTQNKEGISSVIPLNNTSTSSKPTTKADSHKSIGTLATASSCMIVLMGIVLCANN